MLLRIWKFPMHLIFLLDISQSLKFLQIQNQEILIKLILNCQKWERLTYRKSLVVVCICMSFMGKYWRCLFSFLAWLEDAYINMRNIFTGWTKSFLSYSCFLFQLWFQFLNCWDFLLNERSARRRRVNDMIHWVLVFYFFHIRRSKCYQMLLVSWMVEWFNDTQTDGCSPFFLMIWALSMWGPSEKERAALK